tara:strand:- start:673 stop:864 length:192 start_codon:yes stop_codon:yes gene_type:complete
MSNSINDKMFAPGPKPPGPEFLHARHYKSTPKDAAKAKKRRDIEAWHEDRAIERNDNINGEQR